MAELVVTPAMLSKQLKLAAPFIQELMLDPNVFLSFYLYAKERMFLEALHFILLVDSPSSISRFFSPSFSPPFEFPPRPPALQPPLPLLPSSSPPPPPPPFLSQFSIPLLPPHPLILSAFPSRLLLFVYFSR